jgi:hypothetical protein
MSKLEVAADVLSVNVIPLAIGLIGALSDFCIRAFTRGENVGEPHLALAEYILTGQSIYVCPLAGLVAFLRYFANSSGPSAIVVLAVAIYLVAYVTAVLHYRSLGSQGFLHCNPTLKWLYKLAPSVLILVVMGIDVAAAV